MAHADAARKIGCEPRLAESRGLLKDKAYEVLKQLILDWTFKPGTFLSERQLAIRLGMSKTPIRSALERLEHEGFVTISPQQGIVVREFSLEEIVDLFDIRVALETFVVKALSGRLSPAFRTRLEENLERQFEATQTGDVVAATRLDADFHILLCEAHGNQEILRTMLHLRDKLYRVVYRILNHDPQRIATSYDEHRAIGSAVIDGQGDLAAELIAKHLEWGKRALIAR